MGQMAVERSSDERDVEILLTELGLEDDTVIGAATPREAILVQALPFFVIFLCLSNESLCSQDLLGG